MSNQSKQCSGLTLAARDSGPDFFTCGSADRSTDVLVAMFSSPEDLPGRLVRAEFADGFHGGANLEDCRWGQTAPHRLRVATPRHRSVAQAFDCFPAPLAWLRGVPTGGGQRTVDATCHGIRARGAGGFVFARGPTIRPVSDLAPRGRGRNRSGPSGSVA